VSSTLTRRVSSGLAQASDQGQVGAVDGVTIGSSTRDDANPGNAGTEGWFRNQAERLIHATHVDAMLGEAGEWQLQSVLLAHAEALQDRAEIKHHATLLAAPHFEMNRRGCRLFNPDVETYGRLRMRQCIQIAARTGAGDEACRCQPGDILGVLLGIHLHRCHPHGGGFRRPFDHGVEICTQSAGLLLVAHFERERGGIGHVEDRQSRRRTAGVGNVDRQGCRGRWAGVTLTLTNLEQGRAVLAFGAGIAGPREAQSASEIEGGAIRA